MALNWFDKGAGVPDDEGWVDVAPQKTQPTAPTRGILGDIANAVVRIPTVAIPEHVGRTIEAFAPETSKSLLEMAKKGEEEHPMSQQAEEGFIRRNVLGGIESIGAQLALPLLGAAAGGAIGGLVGGPAGAIAGMTTGFKAGGYATAPSYFEAQRNRVAARAEEEALAKGEDPKAARERVMPYAVLSGMIEAGDVIFDTKLVNSLFFKGMKPGAKTLKTILEPSFVKQMGKVMGAEAGTEGLQNVGEEWAARAGGLEPEGTYLEQFAGGAIGGATMGGVLGGVGHAIGVTKRKMVHDALTNTVPAEFTGETFQTAINTRNGIADMVAQGLAQNEEIGPEVAGLWRQYADQQIKENKPIDMESQLDKTNLEILLNINDTTKELGVPADEFVEGTTFKKNAWYNMKVDQEIVDPFGTGVKSKAVVPYTPDVTTREGRAEQRGKYPKELGSVIERVTALPSAISPLDETVSPEVLAHRDKVQYELERADRLIRAKLGNKKTDSIWEQLYKSSPIAGEGEIYEGQEKPMTVFQMIDEAVRNGERLAPILLDAYRQMGGKIGAKIGEVKQQPVVPLGKKLDINEPSAQKEPEKKPVKKAGATKTVTPVTPQADTTTTPEKKKKMTPEELHAFRVENAKRLAGLRTPKKGVAPAPAPAKPAKTVTKPTKAPSVKTQPKPAQKTGGAAPIESGAAEGYKKLKSMFAAYTKEKDPAKKKKMFDEYKAARAEWESTYPVASQEKKKGKKVKEVKKKEKAQVTKPTTTEEIGYVEEEEEKPKKKTETKAKTKEAPKKKGKPTVSEKKDKGVQEYLWKLQDPKKKDYAKAYDKYITGQTEEQPTPHEKLSASDAERIRKHIHTIRGIKKHLKKKGEGWEGVYEPVAPKTKKKKTKAWISEDGTKHEGLQVGDEYDGYGSIEVVTWEDSPETEHLSEDEQKIIVTHIMGDNSVVLKRVPKVISKETIMSVDEAKKLKSTAENYTLLQREIEKAQNKRKVMSKGKKMGDMTKAERKAFDEATKHWAGLADESNRILIDVENNKPASKYKEGESVTFTNKRGATIPGVVTQILKNGNLMVHLNGAKEPQEFRPDQLKLRSGKKATQTSKDYTEKRKADNEKRKTLTKKEVAKEVQKQAAKATATATGRVTVSSGYFLRQLGMDVPPYAGYLPGDPEWHNTWEKFPALRTAMRLYKERVEARPDEKSLLSRAKKLGIEKTFNLLAEGGLTEEEINTLNREFAFLEAKRGNRMEWIIEEEDVFGGIEPTLFEEERQTKKTKAKATTEEPVKSKTTVLYNLPYGMKEEDYIKEWMKNNKKLVEKVKLKGWTLDDLYNDYLAKKRQFWNAGTKYYNPGLPAELVFEGPIAGGWGFSGYAKHAGYIHTGVAEAPMSEDTDISSKKDEPLTLKQAVDELKNGLDNVDYNRLKYLKSRLEAVYLNLNVQQQRMTRAIATEVRRRYYDRYDKVAEHRWDKYVKENGFNNLLSFMDEFDSYAQFAEDMNDRSGIPRSLRATNELLFRRMSELDEFGQPLNIDEKKKALLDKVDSTKAEWKKVQEKHGIGEKSKIAFQRYTAALRDAEKGPRVERRMTMADLLRMPQALFDQMGLPELTDAEVALAEKYAGKKKMSDKAIDAALQEEGYDKTSREEIIKDINAIKSDDYMSPYMAVMANRLANVARNFYLNALSDLTSKDSEGKKNEDKKPSVREWEIATGADEISVTQDTLDEMELKPAEYEHIAQLRAWNAFRLMFSETYPDMPGVERTFFDGLIEDEKGNPSAEATVRDALETVSNVGISKNYESIDSMGYPRGISNIFTRHKQLFSANSIIPKLRTNYALAKKFDLDFVFWCHKNGLDARAAWDESMNKWQEKPKESSLEREEKILRQVTHSKIANLPKFRDEISIMRFIAALEDTFPDEFESISHDVYRYITRDSDSAVTDAQKEKLGRKMLKQYREFKPNYENVSYTRMLFNRLYEPFMKQLEDKSWAKASFADLEKYGFVPYMFIDAKGRDTAFKQAGIEPPRTKKEVTMGKKETKVHELVGKMNLYRHSATTRKIPYVYPTRTVYSASQPESKYYLSEKRPDVERRGDMYEMDDLEYNKLEKKWEVVPVEKEFAERKEQEVGEAYPLRKLSIEELRGEPILLMTNGEKVVAVTSPKGYAKDKVKVTNLDNAMVQNAAGDMDEYYGSRMADLAKKEQVVFQYAQNPKTFGVDRPILITVHSIKDSMNGGASDVSYNPEIHDVVNEHEMVMALGRMAQEPSLQTVYAPSGRENLQRKAQGLEPAKDVYVPSVSRMANLFPKDASVTVTGNIPAYVINVLKDFNTMLGINPIIHIVDRETVLAHQDILPWSLVQEANATDDFLASTVSSFNEHEHYILVTDRMKNFLAVNNPYGVRTFLHEYGHIIINDNFHFASPEVREAIDKDYNSWVSKALHMNFGQFKKHVVSDTKRRMLDSLKRDNNMPAVDALGEELFHYLLKQDEWIADNVEAWASTAKEPMSIIEKWFAKIADLIRMFTDIMSQKLGANVPAMSVVDYLSELQNKRRAQELRIKNLEKMREKRIKARGKTPANTAIQTNSPEFREWFGDSVIVDKKGNPKVMYHGTRADFDTFKIGDVGYHVGTQEQANAILKYEEQKKKNRYRKNEFSYLIGEEDPYMKPERILPVYVAMENPLRLPDVGQWYNEDDVVDAIERSGTFTSEELKQLSKGVHDATMGEVDLDVVSKTSEQKMEEWAQEEFGKGFNELSKSEQEYISHGVYGQEEYENARALEYRGQNSPIMQAIKSFLMDKGYDGIVYLNRQEGILTLPENYSVSDKRPRITSDEAFKLKHPEAEDSYIVFNPEQIKSQFNRGTWSRETGNISRMADVGDLENVEADVNEMKKKTQVTSDGITNATIANAPNNKGFWNWFVTNFEKNLWSLRLFDVGWFQRTFSNPFWLGQKYLEIRQAVSIQEKRDESRIFLIHEFLKDVQGFMGLKGESLKKVEKVLIEGDRELPARYVKLIREKKKDEAKALSELNKYSDEELASRFKLTKEEIAAYNSVRSMLDGLHKRWLDQVKRRAYEMYKTQRWFTVLTEMVGVVADEDMTNYWRNKVGTLWQSWKDAIDAAKVPLQELLITPKELKRIDEGTLKILNTAISRVVDNKEMTEEEAQKIVESAIKRSMKLFKRKDPFQGIYSEADLLKMGIKKEQIKELREGLHTNVLVKNMVTSYMQHYKKVKKTIEELRQTLKDIYKAQGEIIEDDNVINEDIRNLINAYGKTKPRLQQLRNLRNQLDKAVAYFPRERDDRKKMYVAVWDIEKDKEGNIKKDEAGNPLKGRMLYINYYNTEMLGGKNIKAEMWKRLKEEGFTEDDVIVDNDANVRPADATFFRVSDANTQRVIKNALESLHFGSKLSSEHTERLNDILLQAVSDEMNARGFGKHRVRRRMMFDADESLKPILGYKETDLQNVLFNYITGYAGLETKGIASLQFNQVLDGVDKNKPGIWNYIKAYMEDQLRNQEKIDKMNGFMRTIMFAYYLGGSLKAPFVQFTQNFVTGIPFLAQAMRQYYKGENKGRKASLMQAEKVYFKAMKDIATKKLTADEKNFIQQLLDNGVAMDQYIQEVTGRISRSFDSKFDRSVRFLAKPFSEMEIFNRKAAGLAMYRFQKENGVPFENGKISSAAGQIAKEFIYATHYLMGKANLPHPMRGAGGTGQLLRGLYTFRSFTHNYALSIAYSPNGTERIRTLLHSLAYMSLLGGMLSLPFLKDFFDWWEKEHGEDILADARQKLREFGGPMMERAGMYGLVGLILGDISGSLKIGVPFMGDPAETVYGAAGGLMTKGYRSVEALSKGDYYRATENASPEFIANAFRAMRMSKFGEESFGTPGYATTTKGRPLYDEKGRPVRIEGADVFLKMIGFQPTPYSESMEAERGTKSVEKYFEDKRHNIVERFRISKSKGDREGIKDAMDRMREFNKERIEKEATTIVSPLKMSTLVEGAKVMPTKKEKKEARYKQQTY